MVKNTLMQNGKKGRNPFFLNYVTRLGSPEYECVAVTHHLISLHLLHDLELLVCYSYTLIIFSSLAATTIQTKFLTL